MCPGICIPGQAELSFVEGHKTKRTLPLLAFFLMQGHVEAKAHEFLDQNVEGFGQSPLTIFSYIFTRPVTSSDLMVRNSCRR